LEIFEDDENDLEVVVSSKKTSAYYHSEARVFPRSGGRSTPFRWRSLRRNSIQTEHRELRRERRENLPGSGRGRCEAAASIDPPSVGSPDACGVEALPRPRLWLGSPAGASLLSCAIRFTLSVCISVAGKSEGESAEEGRARGNTIFPFFLKVVVSVRDFLPYALRESFASQLATRPFAFPSPLAFWRSLFQVYPRVGGKQKTASGRK